MTRTNSTRQDLNQLGQANFGCDLNRAAELASGMEGEMDGISYDLFGGAVENMYEEWVTLLGGRSVLMDGGAGNTITTPDHASLDLVGDLDLRFEGTWLAAGNGTMVGKWGAAPNLSYRMAFTLFGTVDMTFSPDGTAETNRQFLAAAPGNPMVFRTTLDVVDGANRTYRWFTAKTLAGPWTQINTESPAGNAVIFSGTSPGIIGPGAFKVRRVEIRNGIDGTIVANPDFRFLAPGSPSVTDSTGKVWTLNGTAAVF